MSSDIDPHKKSSPSGIELLSLGVLLALAVVLPLAVGIWFDASRHTSPIGVAVGLLLGIVAATTIVYLRFKRYW